MRLSNRYGELIDLNIIDYEFPFNVEDKWDSNWLNISCHVIHKSGAWQFSGAYLLTWEVKKLANWLRTVALNYDKADDVLEFVEPNLSFQRFLSSSNKGVRLYFEAESRPSWKPHDGSFLADLWIDFDPRTDNILSFAAGLHKQLNKFPIRATNNF